MTKEATFEDKWATVEHWLENWENPLQAKIYADQCAYCKKFILNSLCDGCPIQAITEFPDCEKTPWEAVSRLYHDEYVEMRKYPKVLEEVRKAIEEEYRFLVHIALGEIEEAKALCDI